jgi:hypothetical protein
MKYSLNKFDFIMVLENGNCLKFVMLDFKKYEKHSEYMFLNYRLFE